MLGSDLDGLLVYDRPLPDGGFYPFGVVERYYCMGRGGADLDVSYLFWVAEGDVHFEPSAFAGISGYVMTLRPSAFDRLEAGRVLRDADEVRVYPRFGGVPDAGL